MSLISKGKEMLGISDDEGASESGFVDDTFEEEEAEDGFEEVDEEEEFEEVEDEGPAEWDTAYKCADDLVQGKGFAGTNEFIAKAMAYRIKDSPMYRDRFETGQETAAMIRQTADSLDEIDGGGNSFGDMAEELREANELIDEVEDFTDEEGQMVRDIVQTANKGMEMIANGGGIGGVQTGTVERDEEL